MRSHRADWARAWLRMVKEVSSTVAPLDEALFGTVRHAVGGHAEDAHNERAVLLTLQRLLLASPPSSVRCPNLAEVQQRLQAFIEPCTSCGQPVVDRQAAQLDAWISAHTPGNSNVALCHFPGTGRGLACAHALAAGDVALKLPLRLLLTCETLHPQLATALDEATRRSGSEMLREEIALSLVLLTETAQTSSCWGQYSPLLPERPPGALLWGRERTAAMRTTDLPADVAAVRAALRSTHRRLLPTLRRGDLFPAAASGWRRFLWAYAIVTSRSMVLEPTDGLPRRTALVPLADMLNHSTRAQLAWPAVERDGDEQWLVFRTIGTVAAGQEVFMYYGQLTALQTLQHYGFVEEGQLAFEASRAAEGQPVRDGEDPAADDDVECGEGEEDGSEEDESEEDEGAGEEGDGEASFDDGCEAGDVEHCAEDDGLGTLISLYVERVCGAKRKRVGNCKAEPHDRSCREGCSDAERGSTATPHT